MTEAKGENVGPKPWDSLVASDKKFVQRMQRLGGKSALPADFVVNTDWLTTVRDGRIVKKSFPLYERKSLDVSALSALEELKVNGNKLTELKLGALPRLRSWTSVSAHSSSWTCRGARRSSTSEWTRTASPDCPSCQRAWSSSTAPTIR